VPSRKQMKLRVVSSGQGCDPSFLKIQLAVTTFALKTPLMFVAESWRRNWHEKLIA
jgi:hypothetical protein